MIILDSNVISEPVRPSPYPAVLSWLDQQAIDLLFLTAIGVAELRHGMATVPDGRRRRTLAMALEERILPLFDQRILPFDGPVAAAYA
jgi:predicted nucleic acid-binding protein